MNEMMNRMFEQEKIILELKVDRTFNGAGPNSPAEYSVSLTHPLFEGTLYQRAHNESVIDTLLKAAENKIKQAGLQQESDSSANPVAFPKSSESVVKEGEIAINQNDFNQLINEMLGLFEAVQDLCKMFGVAEGLVWDKFKAGYEGLKKFKS